MKWALDEFQQHCGLEDFSRGESYFSAGRVLKCQITDNPDHLEAYCLVKGHQQKYHVHLLQTEFELRYSCTCPRYADKHYCKHIAAALLACIDSDKPYSSASKRDSNASSQKPKQKKIKSDSNALQMLQSYQQRSEGMAPEHAHLIPRLHTSFSGSYPAFTFQVGFDRPYVVRDLLEFLRNVNNRATASYGKGLTLYHGIEQFDARSQVLIRLLWDQFYEFRTLSASGYYYGSPGYQTSRKNEIIFQGSSFDRLFDLLRGEQIKNTDTNMLIRFIEGDPEITLRIKKKNGAAELSVFPSEDFEYFGSLDSLYIKFEDRIQRCSERFREQVFPLINQKSQIMQLALHDLPTFCSYVLPEITDQVTIDDPSALLQEYLPDDCTPCFYFDIEDDTLQLRLAFRYGESEIPEKTPVEKTPKLRRNLRAEQEAEAAALQYFQRSPSGSLILTGDDAVFDFLGEQLSQFHNYGEVYVSDRLRNKRIQPKNTRVGVSVSNGTLLLEMDTGGFPPEELESLYQSLLKKRRYHRLADGRYLALDGSPCERLAEITHMLQLPAKQLKNGEIEMPAFRGLYLDDVLNGENGIELHRDRQFRAMVRNFKSVAESDYQLPENMENILRPYQKIGFSWLKTLESCGFGGILADEMGLGKTVQVIAFLLTVRRETVGLPSLIVCPASLILNWWDELARFAPDMKALLIMGTAAERKRLLTDGENADVWITSYELLRQDIQQYRDRKFYCCILDEGQHVKNHATLASKAVKQVDAKQRFVLTGTPIENRLSELWNLFDFLMPGYLFTHGQFVDKLEKPVVKSGDEQAAAQLRRLVQPFLLRRLKRDVLRELPPKIEHVRRVPLSEEERKVYFASAAAARQSLSDGQNKMAVLAALTRLRQICCAPSLCYENYEGPLSKVEACLELCSGMTENGHQILLFSQFTSMLDLLRQRLDTMGIHSFTLQGSTPKQERARLVKAFNAGEVPVFLISLKAGGTGLNLTAADVVIHYDPWWNLAAQEQATDRAHRIGQKSHVQVYKLIAQNSIEERILDLQSKKAALMDTVSGDGSAAILEMSQEDLLALI